MISASWLQRTSGLTLRRSRSVLRTKNATVFAAKICQGTCLRIWWIVQLARGAEVPASLTTVRNRDLDPSNKDTLTCRCHFDNLPVSYCIEALGVLCSINRLLWYRVFRILLVVVPPLLWRSLINHDHFFGHTIYGYDMIYNWVGKQTCPPVDHSN